MELIEKALKEENMNDIWWHVDNLYPAVKLEDVSSKDKEMLIKFLLGILYIDKDSDKK